MLGNRRLDCSQDVVLCGGQPASHRILPTHPHARPRPSAQQHLTLDHKTHPVAPHTSPYFPHAVYLSHSLSPLISFSPLSPSFCISITFASFKHISFLSFFLLSFSLSLCFLFAFAPLCCAVCCFVLLCVARTPLRSVLCAAQSSPQLRQRVRI